MPASKRPPWKFTPEEVVVQAIWPGVVAGKSSKDYVPALIDGPEPVGRSGWHIPVAAFSKLPGGGEGLLPKPGMEFLLVCYRYATDEPDRRRTRLWPLADDWCEELKGILHE